MLTWQQIESDYRVAEAAIDQNQYDIAAPILEKLVVAEPAEPLFHWRLGYVYLDSQQLCKAAEQFRIAINQDPECAPAWGGLGQVHWAEGDLDQAEAAFRRRIELKPSPQIYVFLAAVLRAKTDLTAAIEACRRAIEIEPMFDEAYFNLGLYHTLNNNESEARSAFETALKLDSRYEKQVAELLSRFNH